MTFLSLQPALLLLMSIGWPNDFAIDVDEGSETLFLLSKESFVFFQKLNAAFKIILYLSLSKKFRKVLLGKLLCRKEIDEAEAPREHTEENVAPQENVYPQQNVEEGDAETRRGSSWWPMRSASAPQAGTPGASGPGSNVDVEKEKPVDASNAGNWWFRPLSE